MNILRFGLKNAASRLIIPSVTISFAEEHQIPSFEIKDILIDTGTYLFTLIN